MALNLSRRQFIKGSGLSVALPNFYPALAKPSNSNSTIFEIGRTKEAIFERRIHRVFHIGYWNYESPFSDSFNGNSDHYYCDLIPTSELAATEPRR
jgi:hypothetical protein